MKTRKSGSPRAAAGKALIEELVAGSAETQSRPQFEEILRVVA